MKKPSITFSLEKELFYFFCFLNLTGYDVNNNISQWHPLRKYIRDNLKNKININKYSLFKKHIYRKHQGQFVQWILRRKYNKNNPSSFYSKGDLRFFEKFNKYFQDFINQEKKIIPWGRAEKIYLLEKAKNEKEIIKELKDLIEKLNIDLKKLDLSKIIVTPNFLDAYRYGYGPKIGKTAFIVYGPLKKNDYRLIRHELLHSVINSVISNNKSFSRKLKSLRGRKIKQGLKKMGYSNWAIVIEELIIRALNVKLSNSNNKTKLKLLNKEKKKGFNFINKIYESFGDSYKRNELLDILDNILNNIDKLVL